MSATTLQVQASSVSTLLSQPPLVPALQDPSINKRRLATLQETISLRELQERKLDRQVNAKQAFLLELEKKIAAQEELYRAMRKLLTPLLMFYSVLSSLS